MAHQWRMRVLSRLDDPIRESEDCDVFILDLEEFKRASASAKTDRVDLLASIRAVIDFIIATHAKIEAAKGHAGPTIIVAGTDNLDSASRQQIVAAGGSYWQSPAILGSPYDIETFVRDVASERLGRARSPSYGSTSVGGGPPHPTPSIAGGHRAPQEPAVAISADDLTKLQESSRLPGRSWERND